LKTNGDYHGSHLLSLIQESFGHSFEVSKDLALFVVTNWKTGYIVWVGNKEQADFRMCKVKEVQACYNTHYDIELKKIST
jgi:hypothetical protein